MIHPYRLEYRSLDRRLLAIMLPVESLAVLATRAPLLSPLRPHRL